MSAEQTMLVLGGPDSAPALTAKLGDDDVLCCDEPYDGLLEISRRHWPVIILAAGAAHFAALCRATRRLGTDAKVFAVCSAADEPQVRPLTPGVLDDYFIYPLDRSDLAGIRRAAVLADTTGGAGRAISTSQFADLVASARSVPQLEQHVSRRVGQLLDAPVRWTDPDDLPPGIDPLLFVADDSPRVLIPTGPGVSIDASAAAALADLQQLLPALVATARRTEALHRLAITDHLTQAYNRRYFYHATDKILSESARRGFRATLLLYDIDDFKRYNDTYGYAAGDDILRETTAMIRQITRTHDIIARIGGDEFAVLFWEPQEPRTPDSHPPQTAFALADRFRQAVRAHEFSSLGPEATGVLTISGGLATFPRDGATCRELLRKADQAIKAAKASGKDAINLIGQNPGPTPKGD